MYEEYDYSNEPSTGTLKESLYEILHGLQNKDKLREAGQSLKSALQLTPNVTESLGRGGVAQAIGTSGDLRDLSNTINSYLPKGVRNFTRAAEFLANPYATAIQQTAPTTEETLDFVPRATAPYEGYKQHETLGEYVAPALGYLGGKAAKAYGNFVGPTAYKAVEDYMTKTGGILNAVEPGEAKKIQEVASAIDELGFHSPLENAILKIQQPKGTGDQFLKQLEKTPGVKTEELEVTGLKQYLLDNPTVTKQGVQDFIKERRVKLEQKVLGESTGEGNTYEDYELRGGDVYHDQEYIDSMADDLRFDMRNDPDIYIQEKQALLENDPERYAGHETDNGVAALLDEDIDEALMESARIQSEQMYYENPIRHYYDEHNYDIFGNDEMGYSIKDPNGRFLDLGNRNGIYDLSDAEAALRSHLLDQGILSIDEAGAARHEDWTLPGKYENYREILTTHNPAPAIVEKLQNGYFLAKEKPGQTGGLGKTRQEAIDRFHELDEVRKFESSHYEEPNILAHTRLNDRIINGKKTLMVEEIQSDWHQAGRKKGYETPEVRENIAKERQRLLDQKDHYAELAKPYTDLGQDAPPEIVDGWTMAANGLQELQQVENGMRNSVPNAPFKKNWHELMMKQIFNEAVKGDYEAVAFTTGRQQVERYENSLRKAVDKIEFERPNDKAIQIKAFKNGNETFAGNVYDGKFIDGPGNGKTIEEVLGKGIANQINEHELWKPGLIEGKDLTIGGEGMKGFYDKILPDFINKYGKKYGIAVKKEHLTPPDNDRYMNFKDWVNQKDPELHESFIKNSFLHKDDLYKDFINADRKGDEVHYFDLTDMAKKDIKSKGQPMFSGIGLAAPALMPEDQDKTKK